MRRHPAELLARDRLGPVTLEGERVRLEPLTQGHAEALLEVAQAEEIWEWTRFRPRTREEMLRYIDLTLRAQERGDEYPFAVVLRDGGRVIGSTRYLRVQVADRGADIGFSWYAPEFWGTFVNPECKYLLLRHAFEEWGAIRVALTTDVKNVHSAAAIRKLGAKLEGTLRNHRIRRDGSYRDTLIFSIIESEWPAVKAALEVRLRSYGG